MAKNAQLYAVSVVNPNGMRDIEGEISYETKSIVGFRYRRSGSNKVEETHIPRGKIVVLSGARDKPSRVVFHATVNLTKRPMKGYVEPADREGHIKFTPQAGGDAMMIDLNFAHIVSIDEKEDSGAAKSSKKSGDKAKAKKKAA